MLKSLSFGALCAFCLLLAGKPSQAVLYNASYQLSGGGIVAFTFNGTPEVSFPDRIVVNGLLGVPTFNGVAPTPGLKSGLISFTDFSNGAEPGDPPLIEPPRVSFSGQLMDFYYFSDFDAGGGFFMYEPGSGNASLPGGSDFQSLQTGLFASSEDYGKVTEAWDPSRWSVEAVPLPAALPLGLAGVVALGLTALHRRRLQ